MSGRKSKRKGYRIENLLVKKHEAEGLPCWRVPLSGAIGGSLHGDLKLGPRKEWTAEVKARSTGEGWKTMERWMAGCEVMFLHRDRSEPLVVMSWDTYSELMQVYCERSGDQALNAPPSPVGTTDNLGDRKGDGV